MKLGNLRIEIKKMELHPEDLLIIKVKENVPHNVIVQLSDEIKQSLKNKVAGVIILNKEMDINKLTEKDLKKLGLKKIN